jgi:DNA-binding XRE family transcriptional regulator
MCKVRRLWEKQVMNGSKELKELRTQYLKVNQEEMAEILGLSSKVCVSRIENGYPTSNVLKAHIRTLTKQHKKND